MREGVINTYALNFTVPVPANFTYIYFTWRSLIKRPVGGEERVVEGEGDGREWSLQEGVLGREGKAQTSR